MAMIINNTTLEFNVPNSEANVNAQHNGIADRSVGSYYMSEMVDECIEFFNNFDGDFYIDLPILYQNIKPLIDGLIEQRYSKAFKQELRPQKSALETIEWMLTGKENLLIKIAPPSINENRKYLKLNNMNSIIDLVKTLILGDMCKLVFKKIGINGYIIYIDTCETISDLLNNKRMLKWFR